MTTTDVQARILASGLNHAWLNGTTDGSETELQIRDIAGSAKSFGDHLEGQTLRSLRIQLSDGSILTTCILYDEKGGVLASWRGNERTGHDFLYTLRADGLSIPMRKGMKLKVNTGD